MKFQISEFEQINKRFEPASALKNKSSLEYAIAQALGTKDWTKQLAYLLRAIVVDHAFDDGNKRTGAYLIFKFFESNGFIVEPGKVDKLVIRIASKNITKIEVLRRLLHDATI